MTMDAAVRDVQFLPGKGELPVPAAFQPVLERLTADAVSLFGGVVRLEPVSHRERPFSHLLRVAVCRGSRSQPETHLFVKIFKSAGPAQETERMNRRVMADFETTARIHRAMSRWNDLAAVKPVACYPDYLASVTEETAGTTLLEYLEARASWLPAGQRMTDLAATMERVGRWVRAFQSTSPARDTLPAESVREYVDLRLAKLTALPAAGFDQADRRRVLAHIDRLAAAVDPDDFEAVPVHGDLAPGNVLVSKGRVTVLDFAMSGLGSRLHDLARLFLQVELMALKPQFRGSVQQQLNRSLLRGFDADLDPRRPMFRLQLLKHRVNHLGTLSSARAPFPVNAYNWRIRRNHRAWIARELRESEGGA